MLKIIGITGSIGMGKSTIASMLSSLNIPVFDSDKEVRDILKNDKNVIKKISLKWPQVVIVENNTTVLNRKTISDIVFSNKKQKIWLEEIVHPIVSDRRENFTRKHCNKMFVALDVPLLFETETHKLCNFILIANASDKKQKVRVLKRKNMTEKKLELIKNNQYSNDKRKVMFEKSMIITTNYGKLITFIIVVICMIKIFFDSGK